MISAIAISRLELDARQGIRGAEAAASKILPQVEHTTGCAGIPRTYIRQLGTVLPPRRSAACRRVFLSVGNGSNWATDSLPAGCRAIADLGVHPRHLWVGELAAANGGDARFDSHGHRRCVPRNFDDMGTLPNAAGTAAANSSATVASRPGR